jgi:phytoene dehydrogenase-like protein
MNGYRSQIFEMHNIPGGVCTAWKRKGYLFDGCIHHLAGCSEASKLHAMWKELGLLPHPIHYPEELIAVENSEGRRFTVYTDLDRLEAHMLELSPGDAKPIEEFVGAARRFKGLRMMDLVLAKPWEMLKLLPYIPLMGKWGKVTLEEYGKRFNDPFLRRAFGMINYDFENVPAIVALMFLSGCATEDFGWPEGGSLEIAGAIEQRYRALGGEIHYRARVEKVLVENDRAVGVRLADGSEHRADVVISNADGYATIFEMLEGQYADERIRAYYENPPERQEMSLHVGLGVDRDLSDLPHALVLWLPEPVQIADALRDRLYLQFYGFAPEVSPTGKSTVQALFTSGSAYWKALASDRARYREEKERVAQTVIEQLDRRFPGLAAQVEVTDVATPLTTERFVGSHLGYQAWGIPDQGFLEIISGKGLSPTLPGLENFRMVGQWAGGLGLPNVAAMGRKAIQAQCKEDGRRFVTKSSSRLVA